MSLFLQLNLSLLAYLIRSRQDIYFIKVSIENVGQLFYIEIHCVFLCIINVHKPVPCNSKEHHRQDLECCLRYRPCLCYFCYSFVFYSNYLIKNILFTQFIDYLICNLELYHSIEVEIIISYIPFCSESNYVFFVISFTEEEFVSCLPSNIAAASIVAAISGFKNSSNGTSNPPYIELISQTISSNA